MKKSTKVLCLIAGILSALLGLLFLLQTVCLMFNIAGFKDYYIELMLSIGIVGNVSEANSQVYMSIFDSIIGILLNAYASGVYFKLFKTNNIILGSSRILFNLGLLQCFFIVSIITGVIAIIVAMKIKRSENVVINRPRQENTDVNDWTDRINNLKARKESGNITEEQYKEMLNTLIEQMAVSQAKNSQPQDSLQSRIASIKSETKSKQEDE